MKKLILIFSLMLMCIVQSCSEEQLVVEPTTEQLSRSESDMRVSVTNPTLIDDWENVEYIYLNTSSKYEPVRVTTPWKDGGSSNLPEDFAKDVRKNDGWEMLFHTFKDFGTDPGQNYMCLYNKFTGVIKVFYYYEPEGNGTTLSFWNLQSTKPLKIFDTPSFLALTSNQANTNNSLTFSNLTVPIDNNKTGLRHGWNGFSYQVSRYSSENNDCKVTISPRSQNVTEYNFTGNSKGNIDGVIKSITSTNNSILNDGENKHKGIITKTGEGALKLMNAIKTANEKNWGEIFGHNALNIISGLASNDMFKAFNSGLKTLFGRSTVSNHYTKSDVALELMQKIEITGTGTQDVVTGSLVDFNLKDILQGINTSNHTLITKKGGASINHLGTWTLKKSPVLYYYRTVQVHPDSYTITHYPEDRVEVQGTIEAPSFWHEPNTEIEINPDILPYITSYNTSLEYAGCIRADGVYYKGYVDDVYDIYSPKTLYYDENNWTYKLPLTKTNWVCRTPFTSEQINDKVNLMYYDWGEILEGKVIAFITVEMNINYNGHKFKVNETRAYPVEYGYINTYKPEEFHNPPYSFVINYKCPQRTDLFRLYGGDLTRVPHKIYMDY